MSSFTWVYAPVKGLAAERAQALKQFLNWGLEDGQNVARGLGYATLPPEFVDRARKMVNSIQ
jgi:ABC-type phosphate transport system substrate-binding protein